MNMLAEILVPATFFSAVVLTVGLVSYFRFRQRKLLAETVLRLLKDGKQVTPEIIRALSQPVPQSKKDFRSGVVLLGIGISIYIFSVVIELPTSGNMNLKNAVGSLAFIPLVMGITYLLLSRLQLKQ